jgi:hypothetical protein
MDELLDIVRQEVPEINRFSLKIVRQGLQISGYINLSSSFSTLFFFENFIMQRLNLPQRAWVAFYNQSDPAYVGLEHEPDAESVEDIATQRPARSTLLTRAFSPNAWSLVTFVLLTMLIGKFPRCGCDSEDKISIWAMPDSGLCGWRVSCGKKVPNN